MSSTSGPVTDGSPSAHVRSGASATPRLRASRKNKQVSRRPRRSVLLTVLTA